ncbi:MAG: uracil-DNA glycosylase, partial [Flavobacteriales bacterium]
MSQEDNATKRPDIGPGWYEPLAAEFQAPYFAALRAFLVNERERYSIYPPARLIFNAFQTTPFDTVRVVILGQDPYHGPG